MSSCECPVSYYDYGVNIACQKCHYSCLTYVNLVNNSYRTYNVLLQTCNCNENYYDFGILICQQCHYSCLLCNDFGADQCISCQPQATSFRILNGKVYEYLLGYYDNGFTSNCQKFFYKCLSCITSKTLAHLVYKQINYIKINAYVILVIMIVVLVIVVNVTLIVTISISIRILYSIMLAIVNQAQPKQMDYANIVIQIV
ncbi:unnamed protein product [Paramecium octaurelia]|uniref:Transmembrane protein n=1 Tax=Paramecium octaurelia TaxID=43137 RepID=A0A8S1WGW4_PAROT|nr:unnamed protein product [Paramecium octaurelia]